MKDMPAIRATFDAKCIQQAINSRCAPGVTDLILNPDAHCGYGAPVGCVLVSPTHIYPGPVGVDIKCSMSLLQLDLPEDAMSDKATRRAVINAILERTPTGTGRGQRQARKGRHVDATLGRTVVTQGAAPEVCAELGIPPEWARRCEDSFHTGHDGTADALRDRLDRTTAAPGAFDIFAGKMRQLGSYGGGNHFGECEIVRIQDTAATKTLDQKTVDESFDNADIGGHMADQLMVPLAIASFKGAGECAFRTHALTRHAATNSDVVELFAPGASRTVREENGTRWSVQV